MLSFTAGTNIHFINSNNTRLHECELPHDKTNKMACELNKSSDQPGHLSDQILRCPHEESLGP